MGNALEHGGFFATVAGSFVKLDPASQKNLCSKMKSSSNCLGGWKTQPLLKEGLYNEDGVVGMCKRSAP